MITRRKLAISKKQGIGFSQGYRCAICTLLLPVEHEIDHKVPLWAGGKDGPLENLQALCGNCHNAKSRFEARVRTFIKQTNSSFTNMIYTESKITGDIKVFSPHFPPPADEGRFALRI